MKKKTKLLSLLTALTITASAFTGLAVPASAENSSPVTALDYSNGKITITASEATTGTALIIAEYEGEVLQHTTLKTINLQVGSANEEPFDLTGKSAKIFVWDSITGMNPLIDAKTVTPTQAPTYIVNEDYEEDNAKPKFETKARAKTEITTSKVSTNTTKVESIECSGGKDGYAVYTPLSSEQAQNKIVNYEFDVYFAGRICNLSLSAGAKREATTEGRALTFSYNANDGKIKIGNTSIFGNVTTVGDAGKWLHVVAKVNNVTKSTELKVYDTVANGDYSSATANYSGTELFSDSKLDYVTGFDFFAPTTVGIMIDNIKLSTEDINVTMRKVTYSVDGKITDEYVEDGNKVSKVPETEKIGYTFKGWSKDADMDNLLTTEQVKATGIVADTTFTAVYEEDVNYIEPLKTIEFTKVPDGNMLVAGADANTPASNVFEIKATGELGSDLTKNPDERVTDYKVEFKLNGFNWKAQDKTATADSADWPYCDSYGKLVTDNNTADFQLKNHSFNYYGQLTATVTYNGKTQTVSTPISYIGDALANTNSNQILPRGGYYEDVNSYAPDMVGYEATKSANNVSATDVVTDNWATYGGNERKLYIAEENNNRFFRLNATGTNSSSFAANQITAVKDQQIVCDQMVRFYSSGSSILLKSYNPVKWDDSEVAPEDTQATTFAVNFSDNQLSINESKIADAAAETWYRIVVTSDVTSGKCYAEVYDEAGEKLGNSETVDFVNPKSTNPTYYCFRTPDKSTGMLDFNKVKITRATIDKDTIVVTAPDTISVPDEGKNNVTGTMTVTAETTEGLPAIGKAEWSIDDSYNGITITPSADDSHTATITVAAGASTGEIPITVSIGGQTVKKNVTLSASKDNVQFETSTRSISIPSDGSEQYTYIAKVKNKDNVEIEGKNVTYALYDAKNVNPISTPAGMTFENGVLTVTSEAKAITLCVRATSTNSDSETISNFVKVDIHGLAFDFGAGTAEDVVEGYTSVTPTSAYSDKAGYGITGTAIAGGEASTIDATSDYLEGTYTFKANVQKGKTYTVTVTYQGTLQTANVNSDLTGYTLGTSDTMTTEDFTVPAIGEYIDFIISDKDTAKGRIAAVTFTKQDDKSAGEKPHIYTIGDSTIANNGSWAYVMARDYATYSQLPDIATFSNNGRGSRNLMTYYTEGILNGVLTQIRPGDYVMIGDMGTNGMGKTFENDFNYYIDACEAMGAKIILNSYSPHGAVKEYAKVYDSSTNTFTSYRQDDYDNIVRKIYAERTTAEGDKYDANIVGFVDIGKMADAAFNAYVNDYETNGYASKDAAAQAIIKCFSDHNHYSNGTIAAELMIKGYGDGADAKGIVKSLYEIISADLANANQD